MTLDKMISLTDGIQTKADKMRVLERNGYARADIARFLGVRYQQVRNTLEGDKRTGYDPEITPVNHGLGSAVIGSDRLRELTINEDGFGLIPPDVIDEIGDEATPKLLLLSVPGGIYVCTSDSLIERAVTTF